MFIAAKYKSVYAYLKASKFEEYLKNSQFFIVQKLEVVYRLENRNDVNVKQSKVVLLYTKNSIIYLLMKIDWRVLLVTSVKIGSMKIEVTFSKILIFADAN